MSSTRPESITDSRLDRELIFTNEDHYLEQRREEEAKDKERAAAQAQHNDTIFSHRISSTDENAPDDNADSEALGNTAGNGQRTSDGAATAMGAEKDIQLRLKNLDTGEEYIIGETDPDFQFDTFELSYGEFSSDDEEGPSTASQKVDSRTATAATTRASEHKSLSDAMAETGIGIDAMATPSSGSKNGSSSGKKKLTWWQKLVAIFTGKKPSADERDGERSAASRANSFAAVRTPFSKLSSFKFKRELGRGAFGRVLLAEAKTDGTLYALKIISKKNMRQSDKRQAKTERDILLAMGHSDPHPFTTGLKFAFQSVDNLYLGMTYIPGGTLRELIKKYGCLPEEWTRIYSAELVLAISHMHSLKMLYRDIKPHNVMIDARGHITIIDFGLSKQDISSAKGAMSLVGTPDYSAPEVLKTGVHQIEANKAKQKVEKDSARRAAKGHSPSKDKADKSIEDKKKKDAENIGYGKAADWWSLGVMIFEMISGTPAFRGTDLRHTYQRVLFSELIFTPEEKFSEDAKILLTGLLCRDPSKRLGAEDNPPRDLMDSAFFAGISWEEIYACKTAGPWVPEIPKSERRRVEREARAEGRHVGERHSDKDKEGNKRKSKNSNSDKKVGGGGEGVTEEHGVVVGIEKRTVSVENARPIVIGQDTDLYVEGGVCVPGEGGEGIETVTSGPLGTLREGEDDEAEDSYGANNRRDDADIGVQDKDDTVSTTPSDSRSDRSNSSCSHASSDQEGEIHMRDSIFQHSKAANQNNRLQDWSFFDEKMLLSVSNHGKMEKPDANGNTPSGGEIGLPMTLTSDSADGSGFSKKKLTKKNKHNSVTGSNTRSPAESPVKPMTLSSAI